MYSAVSEVWMGFVIKLDCILLIEGIGPNPAFNCFPVTTESKGACMNITEGRSWPAVWYLYLQPAIL